MSNSSIGEVSEVNQILLAFRLKQRKKQWRKFVASVTHYFISDMEDPEREKLTLGGAVNRFHSF